MDERAFWAEVRRWLKIQQQANSQMIARSRNASASAIMEPRKYRPSDCREPVFISPKGWGQEWLAGWVAAKRDELEAMFGAATVREDR